MEKILLLIFAICLFSCVEDKGSYKFEKLNEVSVDSISMEEAIFCISKVDSIFVNPEIKGTITGDDEGNYEYEWYICETGTHSHTTISREKNLAYLVDIDPGTYFLYFEIKDKSTGLKWLKGTNLSVITAVTKGFMILGDFEDGRMALDMVSMPEERDTTVIEDVFNNSEYNFTESEKLLFAGYRRGADAQTLWLTTKEGTHRLTNQEAFEYIAEVNDYGLIETEFEHKTPVRILDMFPHPSTQIRSATNRGYITEDLVVQNSIILGEYFATPCNRYSSSSMTLFKPYPLAFVNGAHSSGYAGIIIYDMDANRFVRLNTYRSATYCMKLYDYDKDPFPWDQAGTGRKIVYGENSYDAPYGASYAIMRDADNNYFIYKFTIQTANTFMVNYRKDNLYNVDLSLALDFDKASHYVFMSNRSVVIYSVGTKLYMYDYAHGQIISRDLGREITYLEAEYCSTGSRDMFLVATYDTTEKGVIRKLQVDSDPNVLEFIDIPRHEWKTRLKVKDVKWKNTP